MKLGQFDALPVIRACPLQIAEAAGDVGEPAKRIAESPPEAERAVSRQSLVEVGRGRTEVTLGEIDLP